MGKRCLKFIKNETFMIRILIKQKNDYINVPSDLYKTIKINR